MMGNLVIFLDINCDRKANFILPYVVSSRWVKVLSLLNPLNSPYLIKVISSLNPNVSNHVEKQTKYSFLSKSVCYMKILCYN